MFEDSIENVYFTADLHLYHNNILRYCERSFDSINQMHNTIIKNFNKVLNENSHLIIIGDLTLLHSEYAARIKKILESIKGYKHLIIGNHDLWKVRNYIEIGISTIHSSLWFRYTDIIFYMMHDPAEYMVIDNGTNVLLCGHVHNLFRHLFPEKRLINVGVDMWEFSPINIQQIMEIVKGG